MWVESGFDPDAFWHQTPGTFALAMKGVRKRLERENDDRLALAWQTAAFGGAAQAGKLKPLKHYMRKSGPQSPKEMVEMLKTMGARSNMTVRRVKLDS